MRNSLLLAALFITSGCASLNALVAPVDVQMLPNDCANQGALIKYYTDLTKLPRNPIVSRDQHERNISKYQREIWRIRYNCNRVS